MIGLANIAGSALLDLADISIALPTGEEYIEGFTRLGEGTAQRVALNMMSTLMGVPPGHVHDWLAADRNTDNFTPRRRATDIECRIARGSWAEAERILENTVCDIKSAVLVSHGRPFARARARPKDHGGTLGACLAHGQMDVDETDLKPQGERE